MSTEIIYVISMTIILTFRNTVISGIKNCRHVSNNVQSKCEVKNVVIQNQTYQTDEWTNITPRIQSLMERKLHLQPQHPLGLIKQRIVDFMYGNYSNVRGNPLFSVHQVCKM